MEIDDTDPDALAMAQAMGFSSFGEQHPAKKRRYNPQSDASLPFAPASNSHNRTNPKSASGANSAPLGTPRAAAPVAATNTDEISLDDDEDGDQVDQGAGGQNPAPAPIASLPARPAVSAPGAGVDSTDQSQSQRQPRQHQHQHPRGQHNPLWYQGYYDPSSNANPWLRLEKKLDLSPRDVWPELSQQQQQPNHATPAATAAPAMNT